MKAQEIEYIPMGLGYLEQQHLLELAEEENSWEEFKPSSPNDTWECVMAIIDDAITNGFEFKFDNGKILFREITACQ